VIKRRPDAARTHLIKASAIKRLPETSPEVFHEVE
jgi:hypothetical protein